MPRRQDTSTMTWARKLLRDIHKLFSVGLISKSVFDKLMKLSYSQQKSEVAKIMRRKGIRRDELSKLRRKVDKIARALESERATHTHRERLTFRILANPNEATYTSNSALGTVSALEGMMSNLRYFNPATNTMVTADPSVGDYQRDILIKSLVYNTKVSNNYQIPCELRIYAMRPRADTNVTPAQYFQQGLADQGNPSVVSPLVYPSDCEILQEQWKVVKSAKKILYPGQSLNLSHSLKEFQYDFSHVDTHATDYQERYNGFSFAYRLEGVLGHDTVQDEQGQLQAGVDVQIDTKVVFEYDAGKDIHDITVNDVSDSFTNVGVVSSKPVSDNLFFSVA